MIEELTEVYLPNCETSEDSFFRRQRINSSELFDVALLCDFLIMVYAIRFSATAFIENPRDLRPGCITP